MKRRRLLLHCYKSKYNPITSYNYHNLNQYNSVTFIVANNYVIPNDSFGLDKKKQVISFSVWFSTHNRKIQIMVTKNQSK